MRKGPFFLGFLLGLSWLVQPGHGLIEVYSGNDDSSVWVPAFQFPNYQAIAGRISGVPSYLRVAIPENDRNGELVEAAPQVWENSRLVPFFLLTDDTPCFPQTVGNDVSGVTAKIFNAQSKGYNGVIIYADASKETVAPPWITNGERVVPGPAQPPITPFPMPIPANIADQICIAVHFVGHDYGLQLTQYA
ncbi:uncharacterized protein LOC129600976 [Paramacrobiotus metropolitanus]|uniref:uncharacterized protein LOC129600976 n=1 Tax=Paramacrobiotus metropolitanus TaxID=2943436 RepID=UPI002445DBFD|nr:uncharacterized protein LOC129600976 [Paramacrobiotus metropolitanus]